jgi:hypothetical protein
MIVSPHCRARRSDDANRHGLSAFRTDILSLALSIPPSDATLYNSSATMRIKEAFR